MRNKKVITILVVCIAVLVIGLVGCMFLISRGSAQKSEKSQVSRQETSEAAEEEINEVTEAKETEQAPEDEVIIPEELTEEVFEDVDEQVFIAADQVNLREEPSTDSEIVGTANLHKLVKRSGVSLSWSRLEYEGMTCYVANEFVTAEQPQLADGDGTIADDSEDTNLSLNSGKIVVIDPGHQANGDSTQEPIGPGASATKPRVSSGTTGSVSGWAEYELNLAVSLQLRDELVKRGYTVYMTRETHDVSMSNKERAEFATAKNADILVRIHANGASSGSVSGALTMAPSDSNPFLPADIIQKSRALSQHIINSYVAATGFADQGVYITDEMSGINWSTMPVTIVEMGYMTNASDDAAMADPAMQVKIVKGISDGIDTYFAN